MASGWGLHGNVSRCFPFWNEFEECCYKYQQDSVNYCWREREDYIECLHHRKEHTRVQRIQEEYEKQFKWSKNLKALQEAKKGEGEDSKSDSGGGGKH